MFTVDQINTAHSKVKTGADFPSYIAEIKQLGVIKYETFVSDSHTRYYGANNFQTQSPAQYENLPIAENPHPELFKSLLLYHQKGKTDYFTFCKDCAATGIDKWIVSLLDKTCTYFDRAGNQVLVEWIP